jgi:hypothetical protein
MQQKDFILKQIEMLSLILLRLTKQLAISHNENDIDVANDTLLKNANINIPELVLIDKENLKAYLNEQNILTNSFIDLEKYLQQLAKFYNNPNSLLAEKYIQTAKYLSQLFEEETGNVYFGM